ncbi:MAG: hypothetical protein M3R27_13065 [Bacteroidota bacterium]|nr:hypothetical protein [Bacteroidota bacterium]
MKRRTYYYIVASGLTAIFIYTLLGTFLRQLDLPILPIEGLRVLFALFIIIYEAASAKKIVKIISFSLFPLALIGYMFRIMHWPFGLLMFLGSLSLILTVLFINAFKSVDNRVEKIVILVYPLSHFIFIITSIYHLPAIWLVFDFFIIGLTAWFLWRRLSRQPKL